MSLLKNIKEELVVERGYPFVLSALIVIVAYSCNYNIIAHSKFSSVLSATINVSAVIVGFMATMVAVLISTINRKTLRRIKDNNAMGLLNSYFRSALINGLLLAVFSTILTMFVGVDDSLIRHLAYLWIFMASYFVFSSLRVILIMLTILESFSLEMSEESIPDDQIQADPDQAFIRVED